VQHKQDHTSKRTNLTGKNRCKTRVRGGAGVWAGLGSIKELALALTNCRSANLLLDTRRCFQHSKLLLGLRNTA
jgi:hypothetical protein